ncbi:low molecular weight phosphatase family protein [Nakamurella sp. UYEF19]|uniref:arsenate reductase/protein-tyrosine-phosphatase family protein n=1 Tax=Nakamurella sp. UYEF19 TaxID=1756392 RepID=UPI0033915021
MYVCRVNRCRSAMAELMLRDLLSLSGHAADVLVGSAGIEAVGGAPVVADAARVLAERGVDSSAFVSRRLRADLVERADLILTAGRDHRDTVVRLVPDAADRCFTLLQFRRLADGIEGLPQWNQAWTLELIRSAIANRGRRPAARPEDNDLTDPTGHGRRWVRRCADRIAESQEVFRWGLAGRRPSG